MYKREFKLTIVPKNCEYVFLVKGREITKYDRVEELLINVKTVNSALSILNNEFKHYDKNVHVYQHPHSKNNKITIPLGKTSNLITYSKDPTLISLGLEYVIKYEMCQPDLNLDAETTKRNDVFNNDTTN